MEINGKRAFQEKINVNGKMVGGNIYCFYWEPVKNAVETQRNGAPVYDKVLKAEIRIPGDKNTVHRPEIEIHYANGQVRQRMSPFYDDTRQIPWRERLSIYLDAWEKEMQTPDDGTPLEQWPKLDVAQCAALRDAGVYSVEMLAGLADNRLNAVMGGMTLRAQAKAWLEAAQGNAQTDALIARNLELEERMKRMEEAFAAMKAAEPEAEPEMKRGPGRPRKDTAA